MSPANRMVYNASLLIGPHFLFRLWVAEVLCRAVLSAILILSKSLLSEGPTLISVF